MLPLSVLVLLLGAWLYSSERAASVQSEADAGLVQLKAIRNELVDQVGDAASDALILSQDAQLIHALTADGNQWATFSNDLLHWLQMKPLYDHIAVLNLAGVEVARVNLGGGDPIIVPPDALMDRANSEAFMQAQGIARGKVYVSTLALAKERGRIVAPAKPVMSLVTPVFNENGTRSGFLVLTLTGNRLIEQMHDGLASNAPFSLLDQDGQWLAGGMPEDTYSLQTGRGKTLRESDPRLFARFNDSDHGYVERDGAIWLFQRIGLVGEDAVRQLGHPHVSLVATQSSRHWVVATALDDQVVGRMSARAFRSTALFLLGALGLAAATSALLASLFERAAANAGAELTLFRLFERLPVAVMVLNQKWEGLFFNETWATLSGRSITASNGTGWMASLDEPDLQALQAALSRALSLNEEQRMELRLRRADGGRWVEFRLAAIPVQFSSRGRFILSISDIHRQREQETQIATALHLLEGVVTGSGDPIVAVDEQYAITLQNPSFGQVCGTLYGTVPSLGDKIAEWLSRWPTDRANLLAQFAIAMDGGVSNVRLTLGPAKRLFDCAFSPLFGRDDTVAGAIMFARDVTEMARMQGRVARNEELLRAVFAGSLDAVFVLEAVRGPGTEIIDFRYIEVAGPQTTTPGWSRGDYVGRLISDRNPVITREYGYFDHFCRAMETGEPFIEELYLDSDGIRAGWYENRVVSLGWGVTLTSRNITERKSAEQALAASEVLQRSILDSSPYAIVAVDRDGYVTLFNRAAEQMLGYEAAEVVGRATPMLFHDNAEIARLAVEMSNETGALVEPGISLIDAVAERCQGQAREWTYVDKRGRTFPVLATITKRRNELGEVIGTMGVAYDISSQKATEAERDRLYAVIEALPDVVGMADLDGNLIYLNQAGRRMRGLLADDDLRGRHISEAWVDWSAQMLTKVALPSVLEGKAWVGETQLVNAEGQVIDVRQLLVAPRMSGREPSFIATILHDLTEIRAMEAKMVEEDALLNSVLESVQDAIVVLDQQGHVQSLNPVVAEIFQYGLHEVIGKEICMLLPEAYHGAVRERLQQGNQAKKRQSTALRREIEGRHKDGTLFPLEMTVSEIMFAEHRIYTVVMRDISERKAAEEQLLENIEELQATQEALATANNQLLGANTELSRMVQIDGLTGVANRRAFDQTLESEWLRAARQQHGLSLLMIDVDYFKRFNDGYGHQMGDECLKQVARLLKSAVARPSDFVARYGGEEFVIILPETEAAGALEVGERVRAAVEHAAIPHAFAEGRDHVTISIGAATLQSLHGVPASILVSAADQALYQAKASGRNRVVSAPAN